MVPHHFLKDLWHTEAFSAFSRMASWTTRFLLSWLWGIYIWLAALFQVLLVKSSLWCERCARVSNNGGLLISRTSKEGDIFLNFSCKDTHHIARGCSSHVFGLPACDSHPLLAFDNVRIDPHCLSLRSRDRNKTFLSVVVRISIDHS